MSNKDERSPRLEQIYFCYLRSECSATFIQAVAQHYTTSSLERLARFGKRQSRRAAMLALSYLGHFDANAILGRGLRDTDRGVRMIAENGIRDIWYRAGNEPQRQTLQRLLRLNQANQFDEAVDVANRLIEEAPWFAEAWYQRAIAYFGSEQFVNSANDCHQALELNPYHFTAAIGMANCYLELNDAQSALQCFQRALHINPHLDGVQAQVRYLQKMLG